MRGKGVKRGVPRRFQLKTTRMEGENNSHLAWWALPSKSGMFSISARGHKKSHKFWRIIQTSRKRNQHVAHDGQRGQKRVPRRFQLKTTRMEGENNSHLAWWALPSKSGMFSTSAVTKNFQILANKLSFTKTHQHVAMRGKGVNGECRRRFQLKTTRMEGENTTFSLIPYLGKSGMFSISTNITKNLTNFGE